jgi:hypothetical protein
MGSLGSKIGFVTGVIIAITLAVPIVRLVVGDCFFEGGCGSYENAGLVLAAAVLIVLALTSGIVIRLLVNRIMTRPDS